MSTLDATYLNDLPTTYTTEVLDLLVESATIPNGLDYPIGYITGYVSAEVPVLEVTQNVAKTVSTRIIESATGLPLTITSGLAAAAVVKLKKVGGNFATVTPTVTARGVYVDIDLTGAHLDTLGIVDITIDITGAVQAQIRLNVIATNKNDAVRGGLSALPNAAAEAAGGLITQGTGVGQLSVTGGAANAQVKGMDANTVNANALATDAVTEIANAVAVAVPSATAIRDAVLDSMRTGHVTVGSIGEAIAIAASLLQGNFYMDNVTNTANGQTASRMRCFHTGAATAAATQGGTGEGEFATFLVTTSYSGPNKITEHRVVQQ